MEANLFVILGVIVGAVLGILLGAVIAACSPRAQAWIRDFLGITLSEAPDGRSLQSAEANPRPPQPPPLRERQQARGAVLRGRILENPDARCRACGRAGSACMCRGAGR